MPEQIRPEFIRLPKPKEYCSYTGLSRTRLYNLVVPTKGNGFKPPVPAKYLRSRGVLRGIWLIPFDQLLAYLQNLPEPTKATDGQGESVACSR